MTGLNYCHLCGNSEVECDLDGCFGCNLWVCPECSGEIIDDDGEPMGVLCDACHDLSREKVAE